MALFEYGTGTQDELEDYFVFEPRSEIREKQEPEQLEFNFNVV